MPMTDSYASQIWSELFSEGTPFEILSFLWFRVTDNAVLSAFLIMIWTFTLRLILVSFYFSLMYFIVAYIKKHLHKKLSIRANYYNWYLLLLSVVLANLWFNNGLITLPAKLFYETNNHYFKNQPDAPIAVCLFLFSVVWLIVVIFKLTALMRMNRRIKRSFRHMERYDDMEGLAEQAVSTLGLRRTPDIWVADYIETPVSCGVIKKVILLPVDYEEKYTTGELYLLLLHEMTHIKHGDTVKLFIMSIVECFLWLTPAMRLFTKNFKRDAELLCDNRVIGLQGSERDTYGNLILKECAYKTARFGFGFSDSYQAIENRLDVLYRYKTDGNLKLLAIIPVILILVCTMSYNFRANWLVVNDNYTSDLQIAVLDADSCEYIPLTPEECAELYEIYGDEWGDFIDYDDDALRTHFGKYAVDGEIQLKHITNNYIMQTGENELSVGMDGRYFLPMGIPEGDELMITHGELSMNHRTLAEYLFLKIASWL